MSERDRGDAAAMDPHAQAQATGVRPAPTADPVTELAIAASPRAEERPLMVGEEAQVPQISEAQLGRLLQELDLNDTHSILFFGSKAQERLTEVSDQMLEGVRAKDVGPAGAALSEMVTTLKGFRVDDLNPNRKPGLLARLTGKGRPVVKFLQEYEAVRDQIETISGQLERHKTKLLTDVTSLDRLYAANLDYFRTLEQYIAAGEAKLAELDESTIPALAAQVATSTDMVEVQRLKDLRGVRDELDRRVYDLKLTRQVTMQGLPSIRMVQENDKGLINKINSTLVNTVPLWRQQLAQAVTIYRSGEAADTIRAATDLTNDLLRANADNLKSANAESRRQIERGVFDIEVVKHANQTLIETIEESLAIADEGKRARAIASQELERLEADLRRTLTSASARRSDG
ncbi:toxic anion resistance protein [Thiocapsa sp.]|uniref:toxic anion resistance protein n=1 Tax=Thiocapsa sp. TaxID=2024551 RepID=UPI0025D61094|nr:toxic anion resistance protein [Thiocapsa sp.]